jgi:pyruvate kinase
MLSAESASGKHPFLSIRTMHEIIAEVERTEEKYYKISLENEFLSPPAAIAASASLSALKLNASAIVCLTTSGKTARLISAFRPKAQIIAVTHLASTLNRLEMVWGIQTLRIEPYDSSDQAMEYIEKLLIELGIAKTGDKVILTMGLPVLERGTTNSLRVYRVHGESLSKKKDIELPLRYRTK